MKIFIPNVIWSDSRLTVNEKILAGVYYYYTVRGNYGYCTLTKKDLMERLYISSNTYQKSKKHLKDLGLIETNGGIKVKYSGKLEDEDKK